MGERFAQGFCGDALMSDLADQEIADLDEDLRENGEWITLRRIAGAAQYPINIDVNVRALVRSPTAAQLQAGFSQANSFVIMSPTEIRQAQWPGGQPPGTLNADVPRGGGANGDRVIIALRTRNIEHVNPIRVDGQLVRIELRVAGPG